MTRLRKERLRRGLNQTEFGKLCGLQQSDISRYEHRLKPIGLTRGRRLCKALAMSRDQLIGNDDFALIERSNERKRPEEDCDL